MLYKKAHRQYLREFRVGRRFKYKYEFGSYSVVCKVTKKLYTSCDNYISIDGVEKDDERHICERTFSLVSIASHPVGQFLYKGEITWLD